MSDSRRPSWKFFFTHWTHPLALGLGSGMTRFAPGTFGSLFGWASFVALNRVLDATGWIALVSVSVVLGIWVCEKTGRDLGVHDHGSIVWDEIVAMWIVLLLTPAGLLCQALAFGLFRLFDITKPPPIAAADAHIRGGIGVMLDDLIAAFYALLALAVVVRAWGYFHG